MKENLCPICAGIGEVWAPSGWGNQMRPSGCEVLSLCQHCRGSGLLRARRAQPNHHEMAMEAAVQAVAEPWKCAQCGEALFFSKPYPGGLCLICHGGAGA